MSLLSIIISFLAYFFFVSLSIKALHKYSKNRINVDSHEFKTYKRLIVVVISFAFLLKSAFYFNTEVLTVLFFLLSAIVFYARIALAMFSDYIHRQPKYYKYLV